MDHKQTGWEGLVCVTVAQYRENCRVAQNANLLTSSGTVSFSENLCPFELFSYGWGIQHARIHL